MLVAALIYTRGWYRLRAALPNEIPGWRLVGFLGGLSGVWIAVAPPPAMLHQASLTIHMTQHLLLMAVAAPLLLLGSPALPLRGGLPAHLCRLTDGTLDTRIVQTLGRVLTCPALCWLAATAAVLGWHVPAAFALGVQSHGWHAAQQASFFAAGPLFLGAILQPLPLLPAGARRSLAPFLFPAHPPRDALLASLLLFYPGVFPCCYDT